MNELSDKTVIIAIIATLIIVFTLAFSLRPSDSDLHPSIQWRQNDQPITDQLEI